MAQSDSEFEWVFFSFGISSFVYCSLDDEWNVAFIENCLNKVR